MMVMLKKGLTVGAFVMAIGAMGVILLAKSKSEPELDKPVLTLLMGKHGRGCGVFNTWEKSLSTSFELGQSPEEVLAVSKPELLAQGWTYEGTIERGTTFEGTTTIGWKFTKRGSWFLNETGTILIGPGYMSKSSLDYCYTARDFRLLWPW